MTFYQELQLNPAGSKAYIATFQTPAEKRKHFAVYLFKILLNIAFCTAFITGFSILFGAENSVAGLSVLLSIMVFRAADLGIRVSHSIGTIFLVFAILAAGPKVSNLLPAGWAFCANAVFLMLLLVLGCHNVIMYNHATLALSYLLLLGYDVSGELYAKRLAGLLAGALLTAAVFYHNHSKTTYKRTFKSLFQEFNLSSARTRWQLRFALTISSTLLLASLLHFPKVMWAGIAAMSVCVPFRNDINYRAGRRILGNLGGCLLFLAAFLLLPEGSLSYLGILGGIGLGLSVSYGWQTTFNSFSALAIAAPVLGLPTAAFLRFFYNAFGSVYTWLFDRIFEPALSFFQDKIAFRFGNSLQPPQSQN